MTDLSQREIGEVAAKIQSSISTALRSVEGDWRIEFNSDNSPRGALQFKLIASDSKVECRLRGAIVQMFSGTQVDEDQTGRTIVVVPIPVTLLPDRIDSGEVISFELTIIVESSGSESRIIQFPQGIGTRESDAEEEVFNTSTTKESTENLRLEPISVLLLSGGGFRATAFHLGVLRWLYEHGHAEDQESGLSDIQHVVGVSGGSITAAHFTLNRQAYLESFNGAEKLIDFLKTQDLRSKVIGGVARLEDLLADLLGPKTDFPEKTNLHILGTSYKTGECFSFNRESVCRHRNHLSEKESDDECQCRPLVRFAVAASTAFPPVLPPLVLNEKILGAKNKRTLEKLLPDAIADGGIRDNLGLDFARSQIWGKSSERILVSDAGRPFDSIELDSLCMQTPLHMFFRLNRTVDIMYQCSASLLQESMEFKHKATLGRGVVKWQSKGAKPPYLQPATNDVNRLIQLIHTDLLPLTPIELFVLVRQGYDSVGDQLGNRYVRIVDEETAAAFWKDLFPKNISNCDSIQAELFSQLDTRASNMKDVSGMAKMIPGTSLEKAVYALLAFAYEHMFQFFFYLLAFFVIYTIFVIWVCS